MTHLTKIVIRPFSAQDQAAAKAVILAGMAEHWGELDPSLNPDLNDIGASYANGRFLVAKTAEGQLVGTGAFVAREAGTVEIVRMSVTAQMRRRGIATRLLEALIAEASTLGATRIILETQVDWADARGFYERHGFVVTHYQEADYGTEVYFERRLSAL